MLRSKLRPYIAHSDAEPKKPATADQFALVLARLKLEYDLSHDVLSAAEDVLQVLKMREKEMRTGIFCSRVPGKFGHIAGLQLSAYLTFDHSMF